MCDLLDDGFKDDEEHDEEKTPEEVKKEEPKKEIETNRIFLPPANLHPLNLVDFIEHNYPYFFTFLRLCCQLADCFYEAFQIASFGEHAQLILRQDHLQLAFIEVCQHRSSARKDAPSLRRHCATAKTFLAAHQTHIAQTINILHPFYWLQWQQSQILQSSIIMSQEIVRIQIKGIVIIAHRRRRRVWRRSVPVQDARLRHGARS